MYFILLFSVLLNFCTLYGQKQYRAVTIVFYNVENLFDTVNSVDVFNPTDPSSRKSVPKATALDIPSFYYRAKTNDKEYKRDTYDQDFTPSGKLQWNTEKYQKKLQRIASVIKSVGSKKANALPALIGLAEIENRKVLEDLVNTKTLAKYNYGIVHFNSPDGRGIDVALLYQKSQFKVLLADAHSVLLSNEEKKDYTRDVLYVKGELAGELIHVLINHWPSRRGGERKSAPKRMLAAEVCRKMIDSILYKNKLAKLVVMGDFNDDPSNQSITKGLRARSKKEDALHNHKYLFNPMYQIDKQGVGSLAYRDKWNLFDQIMISKGFLSEEYASFTFWEAGVYNPSYLLQDKGNFKNYPWRTFAGGIYSGGYSDHMPVYITLIRERKNS